MNIEYEIQPETKEVINHGNHSKGSKRHSTNMTGSIQACTERFRLPRLGMKVAYGHGKKLNVVIFYNMEACSKEW